MSMTVGVDIGSTTVKVVVLKNGELVYRQYERHMSQVRPKTLELLRRARGVLESEPFTIALSGSAGLGMAKAAELPFIQEVFATGEVVERTAPDTDVVIELGGEDAKIIFFTGGLEERMNGSCAGGTGAFIDQMATLLGVTPEELDTLALASEKIYSIASRCGVFAKSDIQPLLNQGARKEDIAASIFKAVVDQTITGLAQGRRINGRVLFLGGPLYFFKGLQREFVRSLKLSPQNAIFPELGRYAVALGSAYHARKAGTPLSFDELMGRMEQTTREAPVSRRLTPLFECQADYEAFCARHARAAVEYAPLEGFQGDAWLGVDCGSTTTKLVLLDGEGRILYDYYGVNKGNPVEVVRQCLTEIYSRGPGAQIRGGAATGYGEDLVKNAFSLDAGLVETMAHFHAARHFNPDVDFILDIGGQDIKCFKVRYNAIDSIMLNEACSSGCGSFISTFAQSMGYDVADFAKKGLFAQFPVDLGSRCTVFMNSSVKQAQKEGAGVEDISAGISVSVVKNAVYKVIRAASAKDLGENIVVQGGTFLNDAVLRSFEMELGRDVVRPAIAGLMGAYGAALYARSLGLSRSSLIGTEALRHFRHESKSAVCGLCGNHCNLTINTFGDEKRFISGNRCERPLKTGKSIVPPPNLYEWKLAELQALTPVRGKRGKIGLPMGLNLYENLPFWHTFFTELGFEVVTSGISRRETYIKGQFSIPSDTVCYPAKLLHGHIAQLLEQGVKTIFYPCLSYNFDEAAGDNHFNCPVVAYYPELLKGNVDELSRSDIRFLYPHLGLHVPATFRKKVFEALREEFPGITRKEVDKASDAAYAAYHAWMERIREEGGRAVERARAEGRKIIVLCGRPYHVDPEINHGIDQLITSFGLAVVTEDAVAHLAAPPAQVHVLNQWTYHARLYNAAKYVTTQADMELVQLVSFGCGIDAITTDEVREILEDGGKLYTQLKIDEITNLGAVKIRIRSLLEAVEERSRGKEARYA